MNCTRNTPTALMGNLYNVANTDKGNYYSCLQNMMLQ